MSVGERVRQAKPRRVPENTVTPTPRAADEQTLQPAPVRTRRSPRLIALGVLAVTLGGLGAAALFDRVAEQEQVVVVTGDLPRGATIGVEDLGVTGLGSTASISHVPAAELDQLIGQTALIDLAGGSVLPAGAIGAQDLAPGDSRLGLRLLPGRLPTGPLTPGDRVSLIPVPPPSGETEATTTGVPIAAVVASAPTLAPDQSSWLVDVEVPERYAGQVAELAATDRVALVREGG